MPTLGFLAICEKVIIDTESGTVSAISFFTKVTGSTPEKPPANAVVPKDWAVLAAWDFSDEVERAKDFVQRIEVFFADGQSFTTGTIPIKFKSDEMRSHTTARLQGFPFGSEGKVRATVWLEVDGQAVTERHSGFVTVAHVLNTPQIPSA